MTAAVPPADSGHPTYTIRTVEDFLAVPEDRIDDCLRDFAFGLHVRRHLASAIVAISERDGVEFDRGPLRFLYFRWIDDGERSARVFFEREEVPR